MKYVPKGMERQLLVVRDTAQMLQVAVVVPDNMQRDRLQEMDACHIAGPIRVIFAVA